MNVDDFLTEMLVDYKVFIDVIVTTDPPSLPDYPQSRRAMLKCGSNGVWPIAGASRP